MKILVAESAGFCFGVNNAVNIVYNLVENSESCIYMLGPIIHNEQVIDELCGKGVRIAENVSDAEDGTTVIIRAHGVTPDIFDEINKRGLKVIDATCPYVKKIQSLAMEEHKRGNVIFIAGDKNHPEVIGINGWCDNSAYIIGEPEEVDKLPEIEQDSCLFSQTTLTKEKYESIYIKLKERCKNIKKFDTICNATSRRQSEAEEIAMQSDLMLVIGSKKSSNTNKLYDICKRHCNTYIIETFGDLPPINIEKINTLGITAGASTPERIIKEVILKMDELNKQENELSFQEAFESSMVTLRSGEIVKGRIIGFNNAEIFVDLGYKSDGIIPVDEYSDDPDFKPEEGITIGEEIDVFIVRVNDGEGNVMLSKKKVDSIKSIDEIEEAYENKTPVTGKIVEITNGGIIASVKGVRIFIPASQIEERYVKDLSKYLKQTVTMRIIEFNKQKRKIVGSQRVLLAEQREQNENEVWSNIEVGKKYNGVVKSLMDFGAFVDIGGVDGLVHVSEISWKKIKHPSDVLKVGDKVQVTVLEFDKDKKRISLGLRKEEDNPWYKVEEKYKIGDIVKGKVVRLVPFGAFVELEKGLDALVHISQISNVRIAKPGDVLEIGQEVEAKIIEVNVESKKISMSIKEVKAIDPVPAVKEEPKKADTESDKSEENEEEVLPTEHKEELNNTIADAFKEIEQDK
jgi:4-hydroxy-3-methylbut-2-enyl diphosphate reductase